MLKVYTDCSTINSSAAATSIYLTNTEYVDMFTDTYENVKSTTEGELLAIIQSVRYVVDNMPDVTELDVHSDCISVINVCDYIIKNARLPKNIKYRQRYQEFLECSKKIKIHLHHVRAHQNSHNVNKACDKISLSVVQRKV